MIDKLTSFTEYLSKIPAALLAALIVTISIILFAPESVASTLSVDGFREKYRVFLGPVLLLLITIACVRIFQIPINIWRSKKLQQRRNETLHNLTPEEKGYLAVYIFNHKNTIYVGMDDGIMCGLRAKQITYLASSMGSLIEGFPFNLSDWARGYLTQNPHLLDNAIGQPRTPQQLMDQRWENS